MAWLESATCEIIEDQNKRVERRSNVWIDSGNWNQATYEREVSTITTRYPALTFAAATAKQQALISAVLPAGTTRNVTIRRANDAGGYEVQDTTETVTPWSLTGTTSTPIEEE